MSEWMIRGSRGLKPYRLPKYCRVCKSDRLFADLKDIGPAQGPLDRFVVEYCDHCGHEQHFRLHAEAVS